MSPSIGRIVHYHSYGTPGGEFKPQPRAAVITAVPKLQEGQVGDGETVSLAVMNPTGLLFQVECPYAETPTPGHWSWPPRV